MNCKDCLLRDTFTVDCNKCKKDKSLHAQIVKWNSDYQILNSRIEEAVSEGAASKKGIMSKVRDAIIKQ